jgi:hypothetical protein
LVWCASRRCGDRDAGGPRLRSMRRVVRGWPAGGVALSRAGAPMSTPWPLPLPASP